MSELNYYNYGYLKLFRNKNFIFGVLLSIIS